MRPTDAGSCVVSGVSSTKAAGVDGSALTLPLLPGRSSEGGSAPAVVLTDWLRVIRADSSAVDATESGLRSRLRLPRERAGTDSASVSSGCSEKVLGRFRVDLVARPGGSVRLVSGLRGSTSGRGTGVPPVMGGRRFSLFHTALRCCCLGGVARAAIMSETMRELSARGGLDAVDGAVAG